MTPPQQPYGHPQQPGFPQQGYPQQQGYPYQQPGYPSQPAQSQLQAGYPQVYPQAPNVQPPPFSQQTAPGNDGLRITAAVLAILVGVYIIVAAVMTVDSVINMTNQDDDYVSVVGMVLRLAGALGFAAAAASLITGAVLLLRKHRIGSTLAWLGSAFAILGFVLDSTGAVLWSMEWAEGYPHLRDRSLSYFLDSIRTTSIIAGIVAVIPLVFALIPSVKRALR